MRVTSVEKGIDKYLAWAAFGALLIYAGALGVSMGKDDPVYIGGAILGAFIMGLALSGWRNARANIHDRAIVTAALAASRAFMTPKETCIPQLQELTKVLVIAGYTVEK